MRGERTIRILSVLRCPLLFSSFPLVSELLCGSHKKFLVLALAGGCRFFPVDLAPNKLCRSRVRECVNSLCGIVIVMILRPSILLSGRRSEYSAGGNLENILCAFHGQRRSALHLKLDSYPTCVSLGNQKARSAVRRTLGADAQPPREANQQDNSKSADEDSRRPACSVWKNRS